MQTQIILYGDSIGKGIVYDEARARYVLSKTRYEKLLADVLPLKNRAVMGATLPMGLANFKTDEWQHGDVIAIEYGGNDCDLDWRAVSQCPDETHPARTPLEEFVTGLSEFVTLARIRGMRPLLVSTVPLHDERYFNWVSRGQDAKNILTYLGDRAHIARWQERYAARVYQIAHMLDCPLFDLRETFLARRDFPDLMCIDGIHPNDAGHRVIADAIQADFYRLRNALS